MLSITREKLRKEDTRQKIELGGLIIKAGLDHEDKAVILGALLNAVNALSGPDSEEQRSKYREAGKQAFTTGD